MSLGSCIIAGLLLGFHLTPETGSQQAAGPPAVREPGSSPGVQYD